jgi:trehalose 6-phosphate phosphatase
LSGLGTQKGTYDNRARQRLTDSKTAIPAAFEMVEDWRRERERFGHLLLALDFDGTLAPIVSRPDEARLLDGAAAAIEQLLKRSDTDVALVSGRSLADLRERCTFDGVYYSGNHGLQMEGPGVQETRKQALTLQPRIRTIAALLQTRLAGIDGLFLEDKDLTLSIHSRMIESEAERERVHSIVQETVRENPAGLKITYGKRVIEVRPDVDWHKGEATLFLIDAIEMERRSPVFPIFIGDDVTDEDAFVALQGRGAGVIVAPKLPQHTAATAYVHSPDEVVQLLEALAD